MAAVDSVNPLVDTVNMPVRTAPDTRSRLLACDSRKTLLPAMNRKIAKPKPTTASSIPRAQAVKLMVAIGLIWFRSLNRFAIA